MGSMIRRILDLSGVYKGRVKAAFVFSVLEAILSKMPIVYAFLILGKFYDGSMEAGVCLLTGIGMVITLVLQIFCHHMSDRLQSGAGYLLFADKRMELGEHLRKLPMGYFTEGNIGKISSVLATDMLFVEENVMTKIANIMSYIFSAAVLIIFLFFLSVPLGIIALITSGTAFLTAARMNRISMSEAEIRQEQSEELTDAVISFIEGIAVIKSYNLLGEKSGELSGNFKKSRDKSIVFEERLTPWMMGLSSIYAVGIAGIFLVSVLIYMRGGFSLPYLLGVLLFVFEIFNPIKALFQETATLSIMNSCLDRMDEVLSEPELADKGRERLKERADAGDEIRFEHVGFSYGEREILHDISFSLKKNTMTALVGPSGSGKTTVANLMARFWDIGKGHIYMRGTDIRDLSLEALMSQISMVFQRVYLFEDTIYNNILIGMTDASEAEVHEAAKKARCYDFIMELPEGFQTMVGEGGATLSGGEKQRISIARSILKDAPIVILDEATASIDSDNESYIQEAISELVKGKTLLVIAHRLHTIKGADQILFLENGRIAERGTHSQLLENEGRYGELYHKLNRRQSWRLQ
ncbi:ABC transporter ATP-binding protein [Lachnospiraceae bacterium 54-53]